MTLPIRIELSADTLEKLARPVVGQGGFQSLLRQIQRRTWQRPGAHADPDRAYSAVSPRLRKWRIPGST